MRRDIFDTGACHHDDDDDDHDDEEKKKETAKEEPFEAEKAKFRSDVSSRRHEKRFCSRRTLLKRCQRFRMLIFGLFIFPSLIV